MIRIIPCLLLLNGALVKTVNFKQFTYIGDPCNTCRIFNELKVDELCILDIRATRNNYINFDLLKEITTECFMPLSYGGGIKCEADAEKLFNIGFEKLVVNSTLFKDVLFIKNLVAHFGSQSIVASIDVKKIKNKYYVYSHSGTHKYNIAPKDWAKILENMGVGEILLTSINREGTWSGYDIELVKSISDSINIPIIANGGAGNLDDIKQVIKFGRVDAVGVSSMVLFQKKGYGVLVNFPNRDEII